MYPDNQVAITMAIQRAKDLEQSLKGYGTPAVTTSNPELAERLKKLRYTIDEFLAVYEFLRT